MAAASAGHRIRHPVSLGAENTDVQRDALEGVAAAYSKDLWSSRKMRAEIHTVEVASEEEHAAGKQGAESCDNAAAFD